ncbi:MAG: shikimate kinase [Clostridia bacterium]|nr:shikimate kinase [Clostridia bacterium]
MLKVHIFIVGMAGAGKTSLGRKLAQNMNLRFVDTDQRVCEMLGMPSVNAIYAALGEDIFRNAETGALMELAGEDPCVVSTGGGICNDNVNVTIMKNHGVIVHIDRPLDQILSDIRTDRRPTLQGGSHEDIIDEYNRQIGFYKAAADYRLDNSKGFAIGLKNLTEIAENITREWGNPAAPAP